MDAPHRSIRRVSLLSRRLLPVAAVPTGSVLRTFVSVVHIVAIRPYVTLAHFTTLIDTLRGQQDAPRTRMEREDSLASLRQ